MQNDNTPDKDLLDSESSDANTSADGDFQVFQTNWSESAQVYMKPHIVTAIDTGTPEQACKSIRTAHVDRYGGTVAVALASGGFMWCTNTKYHYHARYKGMCIGIWSSD